MSNIEEFQDENGQWRFRVKGDNEKIVVSSEGYASRSNARRGVKDLIAILGGGAPVEAVSEPIAPPEDDLYTDEERDERVEEVMDAAWCYLSAARDGNGFDYRMFPMVWPWSQDLWRPGTRDQNLQKASELLNMALRLYTVQMQAQKEGTSE